MKSLILNYMFFVFIPLIIGMSTVNLGVGIFDGPTGFFVNVFLITVNILVWSKTGGCYE